MKNGMEHNGIKEFLEMTFYLSEDELKAIDHLIPMTQELFDSIVDKCADIEAETFFQKFILEYPEFLKIYADKIEQEVLRWEGEERD